MAPRGFPENFQLILPKLLSLIIGSFSFEHSSLGHFCVHQINKHLLAFNLQIFSKFWIEAQTLKRSELFFFSFSRLIFRNLGWSHFLAAQGPSQFNFEASEATLDEKKTFLPHQLRPRRIKTRRATIAALKCLFTLWLHWYFYCLWG